ncbi:hypothetical protein HDU97_009273 [Phlyctochytrium planicorne]|nr:hypothetical protein HDU97_009273 [Phlyctochytrium planicorne]
MEGVSSTPDITHPPPFPTDPLASSPSNPTTKAIPDHNDLASERELLDQAEHQLTVVQLDQALLELKHARSKLDDLKSEPYSALAVNASLQTAVAELTLELSSSNLRNQRLQLALEEGERQRIQALHNLRIEEETRRELEERLIAIMNERAADKDRIAELAQALDSATKAGTNPAGKPALAIPEKRAAIENPAASPASPTSPLSALHICPNCGTSLAPATQSVSEQSGSVVSRRFLEESRATLVKQLQLERDSHLKTAEEKASMQLKLTAVEAENSDLQQRVRSYMQLSEERQRTIVGHFEMLQQFMVTQVANADEAMVNLQNRLSELFSTFMDLLASFHLAYRELSDGQTPDFKTDNRRIFGDMARIESKLHSIHDSCKLYLLTRLGDTASHQLESLLHESSTHTLTRNMVEPPLKTPRSPLPFMILPDPTILLERIRASLGFPTLRKAGPAVRTVASHSLDLIRGFSNDDVAKTTEILRPKLRDVIWTLLFKGRVDRDGDAGSGASLSEKDLLAVSSVGCAVRLLERKRTENSDEDSVETEFAVDSADSDFTAESPLKLPEPLMEKASLPGASPIDPDVPHIFHGKIPLLQTSTATASISANVMLSTTASQTQQPLKDDTPSTHSDNESTGHAAFTKLQSELQALRISRDDALQRIVFLENMVENAQMRSDRLLAQLEAKAADDGAADQGRLAEIQALRGLVEELRENEKALLNRQEAFRANQLNELNKLVELADSKTVQLDAVNAELASLRNQMQNLGSTAHFAEERAKLLQLVDQRTVELKALTSELEVLNQSRNEAEALAAAREADGKRQLLELLNTKTRDLNSANQKLEALTVRMQQIQAAQPESSDHNDSEEKAKLLEQVRTRTEELKAANASLEELRQRLASLSKANEAGDVAGEDFHLLDLVNRRNLELESANAKLDTFEKRIKEADKDLFYYKDAKTFWDKEKELLLKKIDVLEAGTVEKPGPVSKTLALVDSGAQTLSLADTSAGTQKTAIRDNQSQTSIRAQKLDTSETHIANLISAQVKPKSTAKVTVVDNESQTIQFLPNQPISVSTNSAQTDLHFSEIVHIGAHEKLSKQLKEEREASVFAIGKLQESVKQISKDPIKSSPSASDLKDAPIAKPTKSDADLSLVFEDLSRLLKDFDAIVLNPNTRFKSSLFNSDGVKELFRQLHHLYADYNQSLSFLLKKIASFDSSTSFLNHLEVTSMSEALGLLMQYLPTVIIKAKKPSERANSAPSEILALNAKLDSDLQKAIEKAKQMETTNAVLNEKFSLIEVELLEERSKRTNCETAVKSMSEEVEELERRASEAESTKLALEDQLAQANLEISDMSERVCKVEVNLERETNLVAALRRMNEDLTASIDLLASQIRKKDEEFELLRKPLAESVAGQARDIDLEQRFVATEKALRESLSALHDQSAKVDLLQKEALQLKHSHELKLLESSALVKASEENLIRLQTQIDQLKKELVQKQEMIDEACKERDSFRDDLRSLRSRGRADLDRMRSENNSKMVESKKVIIDLENKLKTLGSEKEKDRSRLLQKNDELAKEIANRTQAWSRVESDLKTQIEKLKQQPQEPSGLSYLLDGQNTRSIRKSGGVSMTRSKSETDVSYLSRVADDTILRKHKAASPILISMATQTDTFTVSKASEQLVATLIAESSHQKVIISMLESDCKRYEERLEAMVASESSFLDEISNLKSILESEEKNRDELLNRIYQLQKDVVVIEASKEATEVTLASNYIQVLRSTLSKVKQLAFHNSSNNTDVMALASNGVSQTPLRITYEEANKPLLDQIERQSKEISTLKELKGSWESSCNQMCQLLELEREKVETMKAALDKANAALIQERSKADMASMELKTSLMSISATSKNKVNKLEKENTTHKTDIEDARTELVSLQSNLLQSEKKLSELNESLERWKSRSKQLEAQIQQAQKLFLEKEAEWAQERVTRDAALSDERMKLNEELSRNIELSLKVKENEDILAATVSKQDLKVRELITIVKNAGEVENLLRQENQKLQLERNELKDLFSRKESQFEDKIRLLEVQKANLESDYNLLDKEFHRMKENLTNISRGLVSEVPGHQSENHAGEIYEIRQRLRKEAARTVSLKLELKALKDQLRQSNRELKPVAIQCNLSEETSSLLPKEQSHAVPCGESVSQESQWKRLADLKAESLQAKISFLESALSFTERNDVITASVAIQTSLGVCESVEESGRGAGERLLCERKLRESEENLRNISDEHKQLLAKLNTELETEKAAKVALVTQLESSEWMIKDLLRKQQENVGKLQTLSSNPSIVLEEEVKSLREEKAAFEVHLSEENMNFVNLCREFEKERDGLKRQLDDVLNKANQEQLLRKKLQGRLSEIEKNQEETIKENAKLAEQIEFIMQGKKSSDSKESFDSLRQLVDHYSEADRSLKEELSRERAIVLSQKQRHQQTLKEKDVLISNEKAKSTALEAKVQHELRQSGILRAMLENSNNMLEMLQTESSNIRQESISGDGALAADASVNAAALLELRAERDLALTHLNALRSGTEKVLSTASEEKSHLLRQLHDLQSRYAEAIQGNGVKKETANSVAVLANEFAEYQEPSATKETGAQTKELTVKRRNSSVQTQNITEDPTLEIEHESVTETIIYLPPSGIDSFVDEHQLAEDLAMIQQLAEESRKRNLAFLEQYDRTHTSEIEIDEEIRVMHMATKNAILETASHLDRVYGISRMPFEASNRDRRHLPVADISSDDRDEFTYHVDALANSSSIRYMHTTATDEADEEDFILEGETDPAILDEMRRSLSEIADMKAATASSLEKTAGLLKSTTSSQSLLLPTLPTTGQGNTKASSHNSNAGVLGEDEVIDDLDNDPTIVELRAATANSLAETAKVLQNLQG